MGVIPCDILVPHIDSRVNIILVLHIDSRVNIIDNKRSGASPCDCHCLGVPGHFEPLNRYYIIIDEVFFNNFLVIIYLLVVYKKSHT